MDFTGLSGDELHEAQATLKPTGGGGRRSTYKHNMAAVDRASRRSVRSIARSIDRIDRFDRFGMIFDFLETSGSSRSVRCQSFSSVRRLEAAKTPKNQNEKFWIFGQVRFGRFDNPFDSIDNVPMGDGGPPW